MASLPPNVFVSTHPCLQGKLSQLRSKDMSDSRHVKAAIDQITSILATEATAKALTVTSGPKATSAIGAEYTTTALSADSISIVPILRSGLGMLDGKPSQPTPSHSNPSNSLLTSSFSSSSPPPRTRPNPPPRPLPPTQHPRPRRILQQAPPSHLPFRPHHQPRCLQTRIPHRPHYRHRRYGRSRHSNTEGMGCREDHCVGDLGSERRCGEGSEGVAGGDGGLACGS